MNEQNKAQPETTGLKQTDEPTQFMKHFGPARVPYDRVAWFDASTGLVHVKTRDCVFRVNINDPNDVFPVPAGTDTETALLQCLAAEMRELNTRDVHARAVLRAELDKAKAQFLAKVEEERKNREASDRALGEVLRYLVLSRMDSPSRAIRRYAKRVLKRFSLSEEDIKAMLSRSSAARPAR